MLFDSPRISIANSETRHFDANGNRTNLARTPAATDGSCQTTNPTGVTTKTWAYDTADRITTGYTYDPLGRVTTVPQSGTTTSAITRHYTDDSDNPGWAATTTGGATTIERYAEALGSDLAITVGNDGSVQLPIVDLHGDVTSQIALLATDNNNAIGVESWQDADEYGNPLAGSTTGTTPTNAVNVGLGYGWLGGKQRATESSGLLLMGARLYNPETGQFSSPDDVFRANDTAYSYPTDPVNISDVSGKQPCDCEGGGGGGGKMFRFGGGGRVSAGFRSFGRIMRRASGGVRSRAGRAREYIRNGNSVFRMGRGGAHAELPFRVAIGAGRNHWQRFSRPRKFVQRLHVHLERRGGYINWYTKNKRPPLRLYGRR